MNEALAGVLSGLTVTPAGPGLFSGPLMERNLPKVFGGQILGQGLAAAAKTVDSHRVANSLHAYFLAAGDPALPIEFTVAALKDGATFSFREVRGIQQGRDIFAMDAVFRGEGSGLHFEEITAPLSTADKSEEISRWQPSRTVRLPEWWSTPNGFDIRFESRPVGLVGGDPDEPSLRIWMRPSDSPQLTSAQSVTLLVYASDLSFLDVALHPLGTSWFNESPIVGASIDHAMWLHREFVWTDWLCYSTSCRIIEDGRALVRGEFTDVSGRLIASASQEGFLWRRNLKTQVS